LRNILKGHTRMKGDINADRTVLMGGSILVVMKRKPQNGERKIDEQEERNSSIHEPRFLTHI
jgi:hypothetical protein